MHKGERVREGERERVTARNNAQQSSGLFGAVGLDPMWPGFGAVALVPFSVSGASAVSDALANPPGEVLAPHFPSLVILPEGWLVLWVVHVPLHIAQAARVLVPLLGGNVGHDEGARLAVSWLEFIAEPGHVLQTGMSNVDVLSFPVFVRVDHGVFVGEVEGLHIPNFLFSLRRNIRAHLSLPSIRRIQLVWAGRRALLVRQAVVWCWLCFADVFGRIGLEQLCSQQEV
mmetsp:Transcript_22754/g.38110  ORF Transcript_22754/g.38110 Transcript_22754/m.38110 type:complete len:229 (+) Transcript_22754:581-1267(+)